MYKWDVFSTAGSLNTILLHFAEDRANLEKWKQSSHHRNYRHEQGHRWLKRLSTQSISKVLLHYVTCRAILLRYKLREKLHRVTVSNQQVMWHFCCYQRSSKLNQVQLFATIVAMLQEIFEALPWVTFLCKFLGNGNFDQSMAKNDRFNLSPHLPLFTTSYSEHCMV